MQLCRSKGTHLPVSCSEKVIFLGRSNKWVFLWSCNVLQWIYISPLSSAFCEEPSKDTRGGKWKKHLQPFFTGYCCWAVDKHHCKEASFKKGQENSVLHSWKILSEERDEKSFYFLLCSVAFRIFSRSKDLKIYEYIKSYSCHWCGSSMKYLMYSHAFMQGSWEISPLVRISMCRMVLHKVVIAAQFRLNLYPYLLNSYHIFSARLHLEPWLFLKATAKLEMTFQQQGSATFQRGAI